MKRFSQLSGRVAIVTGGSSGIGEAVVTTLARDGASVIIVDSDEENANRVLEGVGRAGARGSFRKFDLLDHAAIPDLVRSIRLEAGRIDILVNSAGIADSQQNLLRIDEALWDRVYGVNIKAPMLLMHAVATIMVRDGTPGRIVNITSSSAFRAVMSYPAYGSSKAALTQLTRSAAGDLGPYGINVNCVAPGVTRTPLLTKVDVEPKLQQMLETGPLANLLKRVSEPEDVAEVVAFLCSDASRQITGQTIHTSAGAVV